MELITIKIAPHWLYTYSHTQGYLFFPRYEVVFQVNAHAVGLKNNLVPFSSQCTCSYDVIERQLHHCSKNRRLNGRGIRTTAMSGAHWTTLCCSFECWELPVSSLTIQPSLSRSANRVTESRHLTQCVYIFNQKASINFTQWLFNNQCGQKRKSRTTNYSKAVHHMC